MKEKNYDEEYMGFHLSKQLTIEIKVSSVNANTNLKTLIDFKRTSKKLFTIIGYKRI